MRFVLYALTVVAVGALAFQLYRLAVKKGELERELAAIEAKIAPLAKENGKLENDLSSLKDSDTVLRELRRAGYAAPGEKVYVIIPKR